MFIRSSSKRALTGHRPTSSRPPYVVIKHFISWPVLNLFGGARSTRFAAISCALTLYGATTYYTCYGHRQFPFSIPIFSSSFASASNTLSGHCVPHIRNTVQHISRIVQLNCIRSQIYPTLYCLQPLNLFCFYPQLSRNI